MKINLKLLIAFFVTTCSLLYFVNKTERTDIYNNTGVSYEKAKVTRIIKDNITFNENRVGSQIVELQLLTGQFKGKTLEAVSSSSYLYGAVCKRGTKVIVNVNYSDNEIIASVYNYDRGNIIYLVIIIFFVLIIYIGKTKGLKTVISLIITFVCIVFVFLPLVYQGISPIMAACFIIILINLFTLYLLNGMGKKTFCSLAGTTGGVIISAITAWIIGKASNINGMNVADIENLVYISQVTDIQINELLFAGILISSTGAVMDIAVSITSTIFEVNSKNSRLTFAELYQSGMNVGKDMIGTMTNTLILAFTGSSINALIFIYSYKYSYYQILNMYSIGIEFIQSISATTAIILTVPITCAITCLMLKKDKLFT